MPSSTLRTVFQNAGLRGDLEAMDARSDGWPWFRDFRGLAGYDLLSRPVWIFDVDRHAMWWGNESALAFWNAGSLEDFCRRDFSSDSSNVRERLRRIVESGPGSARFQESWTLYPLGQPTTVVTDISPVWIAEGRRAILLEVSYPLNLSHDPEALRLLEAAKNSPLMIATFTLKGELLAQNTAAGLCYGTHGGESSGRAGELAARLQQEADAGLLLEAAHRDETLQRDITVRTLKGERWHRVTAKRGRDPITGQVVLVLSEEDITDHVTLKIELAEAKQRLEERVAKRTQALEMLNRSLSTEIEERGKTEAVLSVRDAWVATILENTPVEIVLKNREGRLLAASRKRWPVEEDGKSRKRLETDERQVMKSGKPLQREVSLQTHDGLKNLVIARFPLVGEGSEPLGTCSITTDITEHKRIQEQLAQVQKMEALGRLTGGVAHDFNNLLAIVQGNAELLADLKGADPELVQPILHASRRGSELTHALLAFARQQALRPQAIDLVALIEQTITILRHTLDPGIAIETDLPEQPLYAFADPGQVELALLNLAFNARDAIGEQGRLSIGCSRRAGPDRSADARAFILVEVADDGEGMSAETRQRAFEPFYTTKEGGKGSGLGLAMVYGFARQSGGHVTCDSREGAGTRIVLYLPEAETAGPRQKATRRKAMPRGSGQTILVLEDDDDLRRLTARVLGNLGYRVREAGDAAAARVAMEESGAVDLLLTDLKLPGGVSGLAFAGEAQARQPTLKVVLMSGNIAEAGDLPPQTPCLRKPFPRSLLAETLYACLQPGG